MKKNNDYPVPSVQQMLDGIENSPYYNIAWQYWEKKGIYAPTGLHALFAYGQFAKIDHRINKGKK